MILPDNKKKASTLIVAGLGGPMKPAPKNEMGDEVDSDMAMQSAGEELLAAIESKSPKAIMQAFKSAYELMCSEDEYEAEEEAE